MKLAEIEPKALYINPVTFVSHTGEDWIAEYHATDDVEGDKPSWEQWGGDNLVEYTVRYYIAQHGLRTDNKEYLDHQVYSVDEEFDHYKIWIADGGFYVRAELDTDD